MECKCGAETYDEHLRRVADGEAAAHCYSGYLSWAERRPANTTEEPARAC